QTCALPIFGSGLANGLRGTAATPESGLAAMPEADRDAMGPIYVLLTVAAVFVACVTSAPAGTWMSPPPTRAPARSPTGLRTMVPATLAPVAPGYPKALKTQPPTMAPTTPSTRSPRRPAGPAPGIAILASQPAMIPTTIHARMLISRSPFLFRWVVICVVYDRSS